MRVFGDINTQAGSEINTTPATPSISSNTLTIDAATANIFVIQHNANITTLNVVHQNDGQTIILILKEVGSGNTITWPGNFFFIGPSTIDATNGEINIAWATYSTTLSTWVVTLETNNSGAGTVTSVALSDGSTTPIYAISGSPVTTSGTLTFTLNTETANTVFAGPTSGGAAQPTFRALVNADVPAGGSTTQVQYNASGLLAGSSEFVFNASTGLVTLTGPAGASTNLILIPAASVGGIPLILRSPDTTMGSDGLKLKYDFNAGTEAAYVGFSPGGTGNDFDVFNKQTGKLNLATGNATRMSIAAGGAVSINSTTSGGADTLVVNQSGAVGGITIQPDSGNSGTGSLVTLNDITGSNSGWYISAGYLHAGLLEFTKISGSLQTLAFNQSGAWKVNGSFGTTGQVLSSNGSSALPSWINAGTGTVTSVAVTGSTGLTVGGSPITTSGTITLTLGTELQGLSALSTNGFVQRTGAGTYTSAALTSGQITTALGYTPLKNTTDTFTGTLTISGGTVTGLATPSAASDAATKAYVDAIAVGITWKNAVKATTTASLTATYVGSPTFTLTNSGTQAAFVTDGYTASSGDRILVKNQSGGGSSGASANGIYSVTTVGSGSTNWVLTRTTDFNEVTPVDEINGAAVYVQQGTLYANTGWTQIDVVVTFDTDPIAFAQFSGAGSGVSSLTGTASQITVSSPTGAVTLSLPNPINVNTTGSAATLTTPRTINGTSFNGSANITVTAAAGTLTGTTLNATVVTSSLTTVGTIGTGTWAGTAIAANHGGTGQTSFTVGDILYADTTSTLATLSASSTVGFVLTSNGSNAAPSYQAVPATSLTSTQIAYGNGSNLVTGTADFTWTEATSPTLTMGSAASTTVTLKITNATTNGATFAITGSNAGTATDAGGAITITGGTGNTTGAGGAVSMTGGSAASNASSIGGTATLQGGPGGATAGSVGGATTVQGGTGTNTGTGAAGGNVTVQGGTSQGSGANIGGSATVSGGTPSATGAGGTATVQGGPGGSTSGNGGAATVQGGTPTSGAGGAVNITAAAGVGTSKSGGNVVITAGAKTSGGTDGVINLVIPATGALQINSAGGTSGQVLTSNGATTAPTWQATGAGTLTNTQIAYGAGGVVSSTSDFTWTEATSPTLTMGTAGSNTATITTPGNTNANASSMSMTGGAATSTAAGAIQAGAVTIQGGQLTGSTATNNNATVNGGIVTVAGGDITSSVTMGSGVGGNLTLRAGNVLSGSTGALNHAGNTLVAGGDQLASTASSSNPGNITVRGGNNAGTGSGVGGTVTILGGTAGTGGGSVNYAGGSVTVQGGGNTGASGGGGGGSVNIIGGTTTSGAGGSITLQTGASTTTTYLTLDASGIFTFGTASAGATFNQVAGTTTGTSFNLNGSNASGTTNTGGAVNITAGTGTTSGLGGALQLIAGQGGSTAAGGVALVQGGSGGSTSGNGGAATVQGGTPTSGAGGAVNITGAAGVGTSKNGGNVVITAGAKTSGGTDGVINLVIPATGALQINSAAGTSGQVLTSNGATTAPTWQTASGGSGADVQVFTTTGAFTWTKPSGKTAVEVNLVGGGGGGGGGAWRNNTANCGGGQGGAAAGISRMTFRASDLGATVAGSVGAGGGGGAAGTAGQGTAGTAGGNSWFGNSSIGSSYIVAFGGNRGSQGFQNAAGSAANSGVATDGVGGTGSLANGANGGNGALGAAGNNGTASANIAGGGGGGGAGQGATFAGGNGGAGSFFFGTAPAGGTGNSGAAGSNGTDLSLSNIPQGGGGGGGGGCVSGSTGSGGGNAGIYGAGGGGGGSSNNSSTAGAGGSGSNGIVIIVSS